MLQEWVREKVKTLQGAREAVWDAVEAMCPVEATGAFYFFVPHPTVIPQEMIIW